MIKLILIIDRSYQNILRSGRPKTGIVDALSIRERPPEVEGRAIPGHWEGDLISDPKNSHIATLLERQLLVQVNDKDTESIISALWGAVNRLPLELKKSLTWDRGGGLGGDIGY